MALWFFHLSLLAETFLLIDKFVKWSWEIKGKVRYKDIVKLQDKYEMKFYGRE